MTDAAARFFDDLARLGHEPLLERASGSVRFDLMHDETTDRWLVRIDKGDVSVSRRSGRADCTVQMEKALFAGLASGEVNAVTAVLRGAMAVNGDLKLLVMFQRLFPGPRESPGTKRGNDAEVSRP